MRGGDKQFHKRQQWVKHLLFKGFLFGFVGFLGLKDCMLKMDAAVPGCFWGFFAF